MRRFKNIKFFDSDSALIEELATSYKALNSFVHFQQLGPDSTLPIDNDSMDLVLLSSDKLSDLQWSERRASGTRAMKPGGRLLTVTGMQSACDS
jgi:hypothetical protein